MRAQCISDTSFVIFSRFPHHHPNPKLVTRYLSVANYLEALFAVEAHVALILRLQVAKHALGVSPR